MKIECQDEGMTIVPEDAQDRAFLDAIGPDEIIFKRIAAPVGFSRPDSAAFVMAAEKRKDTP